MKKNGIVWIAVFAAVFGINGLGAQSSLKGMSANGSTGLYSIPSGKIAWERSSNLALDLGYHAVIHDRNAAHIPKAALSLFKWVELNMALDIQPENDGERGTDFITGAKVQFPLKKTALALGGNFQFLNFGKTENYRYKAGQVYTAVTYTGEFFSMPAETTVVFGKTFVENYSDSNIDFGMGFDLVLLPKYLDRVLHWITDFSNFSYTVDSFSADSWYRGVLNTGLRIDLSIIPVFSKFKFSVDILLTDAFDKNRAFSMGAVFGMPFL